MLTPILLGTRTTGSALATPVTGAAYVGNRDSPTGDGRILWHRGPDGDFTLSNAQAPIEGNYGQRYPVLLCPNTAGIFPMMLFNNCNNRLVHTGNDVCGTPGLRRVIAVPQFFN